MTEGMITMVRTMCEAVGGWSVMGCSGDDVRVFPIE